MNRMKELWAKVVVVLKAAPTWLTAASAVIIIFSEEIGAVLPAGTAETVGQWAAIAVGWLGAAVSIIRRVTPVLPDERGILPKA